MTIHNKVAVFRVEHFNAAHRLNNPLWSKEHNKTIFGLCNNDNFHGHNYKLIVKIVGVPNADTGFVIDLKELSILIREHILIRFDHKNLNLDTIEFANLNPTSENIAIIIYNILRPLISSDLDLYIRLYETKNNFVEYPI